MVKFSTEFISIACNPIIDGAEWSRDFDCIAFAAHQSIALFKPIDQDPTSIGLYQTLHGHSDRINALKIIKRGSAELQKDVAIVSASADKTCRIWILSNDNTWITSCILSDHTASVVALGVVRGRTIKGDCDWIATSCSDGSLRIWKRKENVNGQDTVECFQTIQLGTKYALSLAMGFLPGSNVPFLVTGGSDMNLHIYVLRLNEKFEKVVSLQGHSDWIRSIDIMTFTNTPENANWSTQFKDGDLVIASASQDKYIRLWKVSALVENDNVKNLDSTLDMLEALSGSEMYVFGYANSVSGHRGMQMSTKAHVIQVGENAENKYVLMFHALLMGHEDWVNSVHWQPPRLTESLDYHQPLVLTSASADKSAMIWKPDTETESWFNDVRLGELGGTTLGFYSAFFSPDGCQLVANGYHGALQVWKRGSNTSHWNPHYGISGHQLSVQDLAWDPTGQYLISASLDQSSRLIGEWKRKGKNSWHEMARPQIHGYDLHVLAFIHKYQYLCGADEKVLRVFEAPRNFVESMELLTGEKEDETLKDERPLGASLPALGLSNKALFSEDLEKIKSNTEEYLSPFTAVGYNDLVGKGELSEPPLETSLLQLTLWPEKDKLYGHGFEIITVAASYDGKYLATACKATKPEHATVILWSAETLKQISKLSAHTLTVTCISFSRDNQWMVSAGRDRGWHLYSKTADLNEPYKLTSSNAKAHSRIIWQSTWTPDNRFFATGSRDKTIKIWEPLLPNVLERLVIKFEEAVTACDFAPTCEDNVYRLAVGLENGEIQIIYIHEMEHQLILKDRLSYPQSISHTEAIKSIKWRPRYDKGFYQLASCGLDHSVRIVSLKE